MPADTGAGGDGDLLTPQNDAGDEANNQGGGQGDDADGGVILQPQNDSIDDPINNDPIDGDTILDPTTDPSGDYPYAADPGLLQQRLESETDFNFGSGYLAEFGDEPEQIEQTGDDNSFSAVDDGLAGTGEGALNTRDGTPMLASDTPVTLVDGGSGADEITLGDGAAYAFGGEGDDILRAGEGAAALFGGAGDDELSGGDDNPVWLDGGAGNDAIQGGAADEVIYGGEHGASGGDAPGDDIIDGGGGDDQISGGYGADTLSGGDGDDVIDHLGRLEQEVAWERHRFDWHIDNEADALSGGAGNDMLIMDRADTAEGGEGNDTFWVYFDAGSGSGAAEITDFTPGEDFLRISLNPDIVKSGPEISVGPSEDGQDGLVIVNGETVAVLRGAPGATDADIYIDVTDDVFGG
ncbi:MAG: hypothetical protein P8X51_07290 [Maritimibacter sp.]